MTESEHKHKHICAITGKTVETKTANRVPYGWRRLPDGNPCSPEGWKHAFRLVVLHLVITPDSDGDQKSRREAWKAFREATRVAWSESQALAQWALDRCFAADVRRTPDSPQKMPKAPDIYLYGLAKAEYPRWSAWDGAKGAAVCTLNRAQTKWKQTRYAVLWTQQERPPIYRYPQPYQLDADCWKIIAPADDDECQWKAELALPGGRLRVRIKQGKRAGRGHTRYRSDKDLLERIASDDFIRAESCLLRRDVTNDGSRTAGGRENGKGKLPATSFEYVFKIVGYLPKEERYEGGIAANTLYVSTQPDAMLVALDEDGDRLRAWNWDHVRRWIVGYSKTLQRLSDDRKYEIRRSRRRSKANTQDVHAAKRKHDNRIKSAIEEVTAQVVNMAKRRRCAEINYNDKCRDWITSFPWFTLRTRLEQKCLKEGIEFNPVASGEEDSETLETART